MAKHKKKSAGPAWAQPAAAAQPKAPKRPSTPLDRACADLVAAMERVMRASVRDCYGAGAELALDLGPREPRQPAQRGVLGESLEPVLTAFGSTLDVEGPARIIARCMVDNDERFWALTVALGPSAAPLARTWWRMLEAGRHFDLPPFAHTSYMNVAVVPPHGAPPDVRRTQPHLALRFDGRDYFVFPSCMDTLRRARRVNLVEIEVLTSIAELLACAGETAGFDALPPHDPSGEMTRLAFVDDGAGGVRVEWGTVARMDEPVFDEGEDDEDCDFDLEEGVPTSRWIQVDADVLDGLIDQATRLTLDERFDDAREPRSLTIVLIDSPTEEADAGDPDDELRLEERFLAILDTRTLEQLSLEPLHERTLPGAVRQILDYFEEHQDGRLAHQVLVEDCDLDEALSELLEHEREAVDAPSVDVRYAGAEDAASRYVRAVLAQMLLVIQDVRERETPSRSPAQIAEAAEALDFARLGAAEAYLEFQSQHAHATREADFASFLFSGDGDEVEACRGELEFDDPHFAAGQLAYRVLSALDGHDGGGHEGGGAGSGWLPEALERSEVLKSVEGPLRALVGTAPDLYLVRGQEGGSATLESLTTGAVASMHLTLLTPTPELGEVLPLRRWAFGQSELWLPAGRPLPRGDADALLARLRGQLGDVDAGALRAAAATILRETF